MDVHALRAEVKRRQTAAQRKVARLRRKGVDISGTVHDVRRDASLIGRYNSRQLASYLGQLDAFVDRRNAFVGGDSGVPIRRSAWLAYKRVERAYEKRVASHYEGVKDIFIPEAGVTVSKFDSDMRPKRKPGTGGVPRPLEAIQSLESFQVMSEDKLKKIQQRLEKRLDKGYLPSELKKQKFLMLETLRAYGDDDLVTAGKSLTDEQFDTLWNYTDAPRDVFAGYPIVQLFATGKADERDATIHDSDDIADVKRWIDWAGTLPPREQPTKRGKKRR